MSDWTNAKPDGERLSFPGGDVQLVHDGKASRAHLTIVATQVLRDALAKVAAELLMGEVRHGR